MHVVEILVFDSMVALRAGGGGDSSICDYGARFHFVSLTNTLQPAVTRLL